MAQRDLPDYPAGYDETVRDGPPLDTSVSTGDYRPGRESLTGAGVRGYGSGEPWGRPAYDEQGTELVPGRGNTMGRAQPTDEPYWDAPPDFGAPGGWGRIGGWYHGGTGAQRRRGPKGYKRSDERIREDICEHLMDMDDVDVTNVSVTVKDACVTLDGVVPERAMRYRIEDVAAETLGVNDVVNEIRVPREIR
ncbi:MAG TPA: BON domain-containing protein [Burkholderiales bacterium]|nr:BON domain-containing protein [Burkholderiales bacterium]